MPLITFSSYFGTVVESTARAIAEELNVGYFDDQELHDRALKLGISSSDLDGLDEKAPRLFDRLFTSKPAIYKDLLGSVVYDIASLGQGVIVGHGAQIFLKDFRCALHVMVHASEETRVESIRKEYTIDYEAALQLVHKMDKQQQDFVQFAFNRKISDLLGYDLIINLEKITPEWAIKMIVDLAGSKEVKDCSSKALKVMEISSLQHKLDALFIRNNLTSSYKGVTAEVVEKGKVRLSGIMSNHEEVEWLIGIVKDMAGVDQVISEIAVVPTICNF